VVERVAVHLAARVRDYPAVLVAVAVAILLTPQGHQDKVLLVVQAPQYISAAVAEALALLAVTLLLVVQAELAALLVPHQSQALLYLALAVAAAVQLM
jgi:hypothetical protein